MALIPAHRIETPRASRETAGATRRIFKSSSLAFSEGSVLIPAPGTDPGAPPPPARAASLETPDATQGTDVSVAVREALAAAERGFERRMESALTQAREEAYAAGLEHGRTSTLDELAPHRAQLEQAAGMFERAWDSFADHTEPLLAELSFRLAEGILGSPLPERLRTISTAHLSEALERIGESRAVQVRLHPADFMALSESGIVAQLGKNHPNLSWHTDATLERGDWETRSDAAVVRRVALEMLADLREEFRDMGLDGGTS